ncbi:MAG: hypothetical protein NT080_02840 [Spirochaetes bacterium]|nr:hypothetical protein [Spirochaetota bacterium]
MKLETITLAEEVLPVELDGFVVKRTKALTVVIQEFDFRLDGYVAVRSPDIESVEASDADEFHMSVILKEKLLDEYADRDAVPADSFKSLFSGFAATHELVSVEKPGDFFIVGEVADIDDEGVTLRCMTPAGEWDEEDEFVIYDEITMVHWKNNYLRMFRKHGAPR